jgi:hypothetical protein
MASLKPEFQISFSRGMQDSAAATAYKQDECRLLQNFRVTTDGRAEVRLGTKRTHTTALNSGAQGYGGMQFVLAAGTIQWVVFVGDSMFWSDDYGATWTEEVSSLREDYWSTATMRITSTNWLLSANGNTNSYDYDGTTWGTISNIPSGIKYLAVHNDRLWASDGVKLYGSKILDYDTWAAPDGVSLPINTHEGDDPITGLHVIGAMLVVFKRRSTAYTMGYGNADVITRSGPQGLFTNIGCIAFRTIKSTGDGGMTWLSERGKEYWRPGMDQPVLISAQMQAFFKSIAWRAIQTNRGIPVSVYSPRFLTTETALPESGSQNNATFVYRHPFGEQPGAPSRFGYSQTTAGNNYTLETDAEGYLDIDLTSGAARVRIVDGYLELASSSEVGSYVDIDGSGYLDVDTTTLNPAVLFLADTASQSNVVVSVGYDGFVRVHDEGEYDDVLSTGAGGAEIDGIMQARPMVFGDPFVEKWAQELTVLASHGTETDISVLVESSGGSTREHSLTVRAGSSHPRATKKKLGVRGWDLGPEIRAQTAGLLISGLRLEASLDQDGV